MVRGALPGTTCIDEDFTRAGTGAPVTADNRRAELEDPQRLGAAELVARRRRKAKEARREAGRPVRAARG
jgi:hypothetical protein